MTNDPFTCTEPQTTTISIDLTDAELALALESSGWWLLPKVLKACLVATCTSEGEPLPSIGASPRRRHQSRAHSERGRSHGDNRLPS
jgi:hypothetical protein